MNVQTQDDLTSARRTLRILSVDDAPDMRILIAAYLKHLGCHVDFVHSGDAAVEKVIQSRGYDLVLMDMQMPGMDGYTVARMIRTWEARNQNPRTPILALTACPLDKEIRRALEAGCDAYLAKPVCRTSLLAAIKDVLALTAESGPKEAAGNHRTELIG